MEQKLTAEQRAEVISQLDAKISDLCDHPENNRDFWEKRGRYWFLRLPKPLKRICWLVIQYRACRRGRFQMSRRASLKVAWAVTQVMS